ncbi:MAG: NAD(P)/FAD-dependent oxidoreductase [Methylococcales bacterium]|nr:NAD(P)/FAD-dependent oxidoreductase [Methylococcales bacterium]
MGGGPASSTLAIHLCRQGCKVVIFATPERAAILVGESLVPMIVPMLQDLGVEAEVAAYSVYKPGACFTYNADEVFEFRFADTPSDLPSYSYNVPRDQFNATLLAAAQKAGAKLVARNVQLRRVNDAGRIALDAESIQAAAGFWDEDAPDLIVDAAGRANLIGKLLNIPMQKGPRQDVALFAHVDRTELVDPGYVHNDRMDQGWCWRIPLPGRVSLGFVIPASYALQQGETPEQQYDQLLKTDTVLQRLAPDAKRVTEVLRFNNYQSISEKLCGENWVMLGDAGGFVDPVFSSGMLIAMDSATHLANTILANKPLTDYETVTKRHLTAWFEIVGFYYNGRLMSSINVGRTLTDNYFNRWLFVWISGHISRIFSGAAASSPFCLNLLRFLVTYGLKDQNPDVYKIK